jgi:hypothetical protein
MRISFEMLVKNDLEKQLSYLPVGNYSDEFLMGFRYIAYEFQITLVAYCCANFSDKLIDLNLYELIKSVDDEVMFYCRQAGITYEPDFWKGYNAGREHIRDVMSLNFNTDSIAA